MRRLSTLGPVVLQTVLEHGETGAATGSRRANDLLFGPDMTLTGTSIGRTYLGVSRMDPTAGTNRSIGKMLRRALANPPDPCQWAWDPILHPLIFTSFSKTLTAMWHGAKLSCEPQPQQQGPLPPSSTLLRYRWHGIVPEQPPDPRTHLTFPTRSVCNLYSKATELFGTPDPDDPAPLRCFLEEELGFFRPRVQRPEQTRATQVVLLTIAIRTWSAYSFMNRLRERIAELEIYHNDLRKQQQERGKDPERQVPRQHPTVASGGGVAGDATARTIRSEAELHRLQHLEFLLQVWVDQMLDLSLWMQQQPSVFATNYIDSPALQRAATMTLYPHGRRYVSILDLPDLVPWLPYSSAGQDYEYWSPTGGGGGRTMPATTILDGATTRGSVEKTVGAATLPHRPNSTTSTTTTDHQRPVGMSDQQQQQQRSSLDPAQSPAFAPRSQNAAKTTTNASASTTSSSPSVSSCPSNATSASHLHHGMVALAHMVLSKSHPHPCKIRNLDEIAVRKALEEPAIGLVILDVVHILFMGAYPGCNTRPNFAVRARIRAQSIAFRGATDKEVGIWICDNYRLLHLAFKIWYLHVVRLSPAFEAALTDIQRHAEYASHVHQAVAQIQNLMDVWGRPNRARFDQRVDTWLAMVASRSVSDQQKWNPWRMPYPMLPDYVSLPPPNLLNDAAHMSHGDTAPSLNKLRKGSFVQTLTVRMRTWMRSLCTEKRGSASRTVSQQYKEEMAQMMVLSKLVHSQPLYGAHVVQTVMAATAAGGDTTEAQDAIPYWRRGIPDSLDPIQPWALGVPLVGLPPTLIHSFLKWEGDSELPSSVWYGDRSFFLKEPYHFIPDLDTLYAIDLAAWMCARRNDGRFVTAWLRFPIGLSAMAYQRLVTLYFNYECCDVADNSFMLQLRRFLFRRRRRVIPAAEYEQRLANHDPSLVTQATEPIQIVDRSAVTNNPGPEEGQHRNRYRLKTVAYRVVEEYATPQSRRDFAILYEYANRVAAYSSWSVVRLPKYVLENQIEAVRQRFTIEPWRRTDVSHLGCRHLCACGRWSGKIVLPPLRSVTSAAAERRRSACAGTDIRRMVEQVQETTQKQLLELLERHRRKMAHLERAYGRDMKALEQKHAAESEASLSPVASEQHQRVLSSAKENLVARYEQRASKMQQQLDRREKNIVEHALLTMARIDAEQPLIHNEIPTRRSTRAATAGKFTIAHTGSTSATMGRAGGSGHTGTTHTRSMLAGGSGGSGGGGVVAMLDEHDVRMNLTTRRWATSDWIWRGEPGSERPQQQRRQEEEEEEEDGSQAERAVVGNQGRRKRKQRPSAMNANLRRCLESIRAESEMQKRSRHNAGSIVVLPEEAEVMTRDVHPSTDAHVIGDTQLSCDQAAALLDAGIKQGHIELAAQKKNRTPYCHSRLFRINLLGQAVRAKGPKAQPFGPFVTLCATCGAMTTVDLGRWNHRGPTCGAHGRPHRLPDRFAEYDVSIDGPVVAQQALVLAGLAAQQVEPIMPESFFTAAEHGQLQQHANHIPTATSAMPSFPDLGTVQPLVGYRSLYDGCDVVTLMQMFTPHPSVAQQLESLLSIMDFRAGLPCLEEIPCCWYCSMEADRRPKLIKRNSSSSSSSSRGASSNGTDMPHATRRNQVGSEPQTFADVLMSGSGPIRSSNGDGETVVQVVEAQGVLRRPRPETAHRGDAHVTLDANDDSEAEWHGTDHLDPDPFAIRYAPGTSAATAIAGTSGAVIQARGMTLGGTHQAPPIRRVNIRNMSLGPSGSPFACGGDVVVGPGLPGDHSGPHLHACATNGCDCLSKAYAEWSDAESANAMPARLRYLHAVGQQRRRHASATEARILPIEMLPSVGEEMAILVLDDVSKAAAAAHRGRGTMFHRWIYLCPRHVKELRMGWIARTARIVQGLAEKEAKQALLYVDGDHKRLPNITLVRAAAKQRIGRPAMVEYMFRHTLLLSDVLHSIRRGHRTRVRQQLHFGGGTPGARMIPEYKRGKKNQ